ncbi:diguanylate cyclase [Telluria mixta]|uniref:diguanylate cyclase n=1 Tax=Telluria mixta TaxID=34071 RepID=A0ABT2C0X8_9BURK|nr:GGDEF domain-containing protein [Telluria mixta]MCS0630511.1 diguanylate cyclase [Telluria mixta]WEM94184.1 diguanylate cyclase [Telluria mixta]
MFPFPSAWRRPHAAGDGAVLPTRATAASGQRARSMARIVCWLLLADFVFCIGFAVWTRTLAYENDIAQGGIAVRHLADTALSHADAALDRTAWMLDGVADRIVANGAPAVADPGLQRMLAARIGERDTPFDSLAIVDRAGHVLATAGHADRPGADAGRRAALVHHGAHADRGVHVGLAPGGQALTVSRRIDDSDGRFAGVALASIAVQYFQNDYRRLALGRHGTVALSLADGTPVARVPAVQVDVRPVPIGLATKAREVERLHDGRRSSRYPLAVDAALGRDEVLADWRRITWQESAALAGEMLAVYLVSFWLVAQMRIRERLERTLHSTQEALELKNAALERLAHTDGLTGLHNRRHLDDRMAAEVGRAARERTNLSLIMMDVDFFKRYNDTYGHAAGDDCLRMVAGVLAATVNRPADLAARFGGEEFAILLPNTPREGALAIAEAICRGVEAIGVAHAASDHATVTVSAGVATVVPAPGDDARALVEAADAALYAAKEAGRNTVRA